MYIDGFTLLADIREKPVDWLWEYRVPLGEITVLEGDPGVNKSSVAYNLAARLTNGNGMPGEASKPGRKRQGGALLLIGEDSLKKTVKVRLAVAGADDRKVATLVNVLVPKDLLTVEKAILEIQAKLLVIDTLNDFLACNVLGNQAVRDALRPLRALAEKRNVAVLVVRHLVKSSSNSLLRGGGSVAVTAMARSQLKVYRHPADPNLRVLVQDKSNLGPLSPPLVFEVVPGESNGFRLEWHGECEFDIEDLKRKHKSSPRLEAAEKLLVEKLADGPRDVKSLLAEAKNICSKRTLDEAKKSLGLKTTREGRGKDHTVYWSL